MSHSRVWKGLLLFGLFVLLAVMPKLVSEFRLNLVIAMLIYSLVAIGFNMLFGQGGLLSFGHAAYFGIGAYTAILVYKHLGFSLLLWHFGRGCVWSFVRGAFWSLFGAIARIAIRLVKYGVQCTDLCCG